MRTLLAVTAFGTIAALGGTVLTFVTTAQRSEPRRIFPVAFEDVGICLMQEHRVLDGLLQAKPRGTLRDPQTLARMVAAARATQPAPALQRHESRRQHGERLPQWPPNSRQVKERVFSRRAGGNATARFARVTDRCDRCDR
ncbi:MAG: hypothetical protein QF570_01860 [Myxococcota bacterium]|nr:hypothetical protein [Myxococcota bacterium]